MLRWWLVTGRSPARWKKSRAQLLVGSATGNSADRINAGGSFVNGQGRVHQRCQCLSQVWVCDLIAGLASLMLSDHNATVAQTGQMGGYIGRGQPKIAGKHCRIFRPLQQRQQNSGPCRIGHGSTQPVHHLQTSSINQHRLNYTTDTELALSEFPNVALSVAAGRWGRAVPGLRRSVLQRMACETSHPKLLNSHEFKHRGVLQLCLATKV